MLTLAQALQVFYPGIDRVAWQGVGRFSALPQHILGEFLTDEALALPTVMGTNVRAAFHSLMPNHVYVVEKRLGDM